MYKKNTHLRNHFSFDSFIENRKRMGLNNDFQIKGSNERFKHSMAIKRHINRKNDMLRVTFKSNKRKRNSSESLVDCRGRRKKITDDDDLNKLKKRFKQTFSIPSEEINDLPMYPTTRLFNSRLERIKKKKLILCI